MGADDKPPSTTPPPSSGEADRSSPSLEELDSAWAEEGEEYDEDATMVAKVPLDLVALSRRGTELESKPRIEPERHEAITARPPPPASGEASVVVDAPHQTLPKIEVEEAEENEDEQDEDDLDADDLDAGWDIEEERAAAADVAAGLDPEARRKAADARAVQRRDKQRAKKLAAKEKRRARADSIRLKQKKPKKRSIPPPRPSSSARSTPPRAAVEAAEGSESRERPTIPPAEPRGAVVVAPGSASKTRRDATRMAFFVALVVVLGALAIGLMRR